MRETSPRGVNGLSGPGSLESGLNDAPQPASAMRILIIGGTGFIGPYMTRALIARKHKVALFNRGNKVRRIPEGAELIRGDKADLSRSRDQIASFGPDVTVHMVAYCSDDANQFVTALRGIVSNLTVVSSCDVYRAFVRLHRTEPGQIEPCPLTENSPLRQRVSIHGGKNEKRFVERIVLESCLPTTVLRLPAVYGPGDPQGRWYPFLKRMKDGRPNIILGEKQARWRFSAAYVENVAHAICLAATSLSSRNRIFNVGEERTPTLAEHIKKLKDIVGWNGYTLVVLDKDLPDHLKSPGDCAQSLIVDSSRIRQDLGYSEVVDDETAARQSIEWYLKNPPRQMRYGQLLYDQEDQAIARLDL